jgi:hypothetical protein
MQSRENNPKIYVKIWVVYKKEVEKLSKKCYYSRGGGVA